MLKALKSNGVSEEDAYQITFHLTDWLDDLKPFVVFLENPESYSNDEVNKILIRFLVHAPDHMNTAAEIIINAGDENQND